MNKLRAGRIIERKKKLKQKKCVIRVGVDCIFANNIFQTDGILALGDL